MAVSFIGGGNRSTRKKITDQSQVTNKTLSHNVVSSTPRHERGSNSRLWWWKGLIAQVVMNRTTIRSRPRRPLLVTLININHLMMIVYAIHVLAKESSSRCIIFYNYCLLLFFIIGNISTISYRDILITLKVNKEIWKILLIYIKL
jgi:hypothetical protein